jgi:hypothetical protein
MADLAHFSAGTGQRCHGRGIRPMRDFELSGISACGPF